MEPGSNYQTPLRTPRSRRKALSPQTTPSVYSSPYQVFTSEMTKQGKSQVLELTPSADDLDSVKKRLVEQDEVIHNLKGTIEDLQTAMVDKLDESILIETSTKLSIQDKRVHNTTINMLQEELQKQKELVSSARKEKEAETRSRLSQAVKDSQALREAEEKVETLQADLTFHMDKCADMEQKLAEQKENDSREIRHLRDELTEAQCQRRILEEKLNQEKLNVKELRKQLNDVNDSLGTSRKKEIELNLKLDSESKARKSAEEELNSLKEAQKDQVLREVQSISTHLIKIPQGKSPDVNTIEQLGALKNTLEYKNKEIKELKEKEDELLQQLEEEKQRVTSAEEEVKTLRKELLESEDCKITTALILETEKIKQQKAEIRCELIKQQKENKKLIEKMENMDISTTHKEELSQKEAEIQTAKVENTILTDRVETLRLRVEQLEEKLRKKQEDYELAVADKEEKSLLRKDRDGLEACNSELRNYLVILDEQVEQFRDKKNKAEIALKRAQTDIAELREKLRLAEHNVDEVRSSEALLSQLRADKERLEARVAFLTEELSISNSEHREDLARMSREISETKQRARMAHEKADHSFIVADLKKQIAQHDSAMRSCKRQIDDLKQDNEKLQSQVSEILAREKTTTAENTRLRQGLTDSIAKLEQYKKDLDEQKEINQEFAEKAGEFEEKMTKIKDEKSDLEDIIQEKEGLISYLQSQINVKQLPKVSRRSTLLKTISDVSIASSAVESLDSPDMEEVKELENQLSQLRKERDEKKQILHERRNTPPTIQPFKVPLAPIQNLPESQSQIIQPKAVMRHDIAHRWKDLRHISIFSRKCAVCFVGVPTLGKARRCDYCQVVVHAQCSRRVANTCGLPESYANYYVESYTAPMGKMNGWIRIFRDDTDSKTWDSCWALMDERTISFYDKESVEGDLSRPFLKVDLYNENFLVRAGTAAPQNAEACTQAASIIQLKLAKMSIFILAPSIQSAKRWTEALQAAQTRRMMLTRKPSSFSEQSCILSLNAPNNLTVHSTAVIDDCLLIGAKGGLFFTHFSSPRMPIRFGGVDSVLAMEIMPEINTVALISGAQKYLSILPLSTLKNQFSSTQPQVRLDIIGGLSHLHLLAYHQQDGQKYLFAADTIKLHILKYNSHRDVFVPFHSIETSEPSMCLQSTQSGFYFGSDSFYKIDLSGIPREIALAPAHVADYPIAILNIGDKELLLAYQNYGIFVNPQGIRTREQVVEWEQMPMEFVYTAPFLYVIHYDSIEIMQVAENLGPDCKTIFDEREIFTCQNAHIVGTRSNGDIFVTISSKDSTELHKFNATQQRRTMKRRGISLSHFATTSDKRSKVAS